MIFLALLVGIELLVWWLHPPPVLAAGTPQVRFSTVADGQHVAGVVHLVVDVTHAHPVSQVTLTKSTEILGVDFEPPFEFDWDTRKEADGPFLLQAAALDADFRKGTARLTLVADNTPPSVTLTEPSEGTIAVGTVTLAADATDVLGVGAVRFLLNGNVIAEVTSAPYRFAWDSNTVPNTRYGLQARAVDLAGNSANSKEVRVRAANFNQHPVLERIGPQQVQESAPLAFVVKASDPDGPRDPIVYRVANLPAWATFDAQSGQFTGTPPATEASLKHPTKAYAVSVEACDPQPLCDSEEVVITVIDRNRPPVLQPVPSPRIKKGDALNLKLQWEDPDGDETTCRARGVPKWASFSASSCTLRGSPGLDVTSLEERTVVFKDILFEVCDKQPLCASQTSTITVDDMQHAPAWMPVANQVVPEDQRLEIEVQASDVDQDALKLRAEVLPDGAVLEDHGDGTGSVTWRPRPDQSGRHEVVLSASDSDLSALLRIAIRVTERVLAISGVVADNQKQPVAGVLIRLLFKGSPIQEVTTDARGAYLLTGLKPGAYIVKPLYKIERTFGSEQKFTTVSFAPSSARIELASTDSRGLDFQIELK